MRLTIALPDILLRLVYNTTQRVLCGGGGGGEVQQKCVHRNRLGFSSCVSGVHGLRRIVKRGLLLLPLVLGRSCIYNRTRT